MKVKIKSKEEVQIMREGGKILHDILLELIEYVQEGISTKDIDDKARALCYVYNVKPGFLGYQGFPATTCIGVNDVVVHGIPSDKEILNDGDILSVDMGVILKDFYLDSAKTTGVGTIDKESRRFVETTRKALAEAIEQAFSGKTLGDIGYAIESTVTEEGYSVVKQMVGHGIGKELHEPPKIPGYGKKGEGIELEENMTLAIEAIINQGSDGIYILEDGWTSKTSDGKLSALFEHTVLVGKKKAEILT